MGTYKLLSVSCNFYRGKVDSEVLKFQTQVHLALILTWNYHLYNFKVFHDYTSNTDKPNQCKIPMLWKIIWNSKETYLGNRN